MVEISKRGITLSSSLCAFCGVEEETAIHIFLLCRWVIEVWALLECWCEIKTSEIVSMEQLVSTSNFFLQTPLQQKIMHIVLLTTIWFIWKARNDLVFNLTVTSPGKVVAEIKATSFL